MECSGTWMFLRDLLCDELFASRLRQGVWPFCTFGKQTLLLALSQIFLEPVAYVVPTQMKLNDILILSTHLHRNRVVTDHTQLIFQVSISWLNNHMPRIT